MDALILNLSPALFWDTNPENINPDKNAPYIVERVITLGNLKEFKAILEYYGKTRLKDIIVRLRDLDIRTIHFCSIYFKVPLNDFRCYEKKLSNRPHWNY
jgi:hypothetical protein